MHKSALLIMEWFVKKYLPGGSVKVLDVGSRVLPHQTKLGSHRPLFAENHYVGTDIELGENVDIVADAANLPLPDKSFHVVVSSQLLEHVKYPWVVVAEMARVLTPGGLCCIIAPAKAPRHRYPIDTYRYNPDGLQALAKWAGLTPLRARTKRADRIVTDCYLVARKP